MKILIIEDNADISTNIGLYFENKGHFVDFAYNGLHGLNLAQAHRFDIIVLDLMLPGMDGDIEKLFKYGVAGKNNGSHGLGLYISRLICDKQGWKLALLSNHPGTQATVTFPPNNTSAR